VAAGPGDETRQPRVPASSSACSSSAVSTPAQNRISTSHHIDGGMPTHPANAIYWHARGGYSYFMLRRTVFLVALLGAACGRVEGVPADAGIPDAEPFVCQTQSDCDAVSGCGAWNECSGFGGACLEDGEQQRVCNRYTCGAAGVCVVTDSNVEKQACTRDSTGLECGVKTCGEYTECGGFADPACGESGTRSRSCNVDVCQGGECVPTVKEETASCERTTDNLACGEDCVVSGACAFPADECAQAGSQPMVCTARACVDGACVPSTTTRDTTQTCSRSTEGNTCAGGAVACSQSCPFSDDTPANQCAEDITGTETCIPHKCQSGACALAPGSATQTSIACHRETDGQQCLTVRCPGTQTGDRYRCCSGGVCDTTTFCFSDCELIDPR
jgi:hypothetical protein